MGDNDFIRRGDAARAVALCSAESDSPNAHFVCRQAVNAIRALPAADLAELTDPVAVHANMLRGTIAKPTVEQIIHLYGREAFQPIIDAAVAKALEDACLAVSEHAGWPEDEHGRTEQVGLFARVINAIRAIPAADARAEALKEAAAVAAKFDSDGMYGAAAIHDAILALAPTTTTR